MTKARKLGGEPRAEYDTGYGKPPKAHQFKPGQSGNRKGRPAGAKSFKQMMLAVLREKVPVSAGGKRRSVTRLEAAVLSLSNGMIANRDLKAAGALMQLGQLCGMLEGAQDSGPESVSEHEMAQIQKLLADAGFPD